jgi:heme/copper-type cytochrome/quinol oxidase subunit 4
MLPTILFVIGPPALVILALIIYFGLSKKSAPLVRLAALIAIGVIILTGLVCLIIILNSLEPGVKAGPPAGFLAGAPAIPVQDNLVIFITLVAFIIVLLGMVVFMSLREQRRKKDENNF